MTAETLFFVMLAFVVLFPIALGLSWSHGSRSTRHVYQESYQFSQALNEQMKGERQTLISQLEACRKESQEIRSSYERQIRDLTKRLADLESKYNQAIFELSRSDDADDINH